MQRVFLKLDNPMKSDKKKDANRMLIYAIIKLKNTCLYED